MSLPNNQQSDPSEREHHTNNLASVCVRVSVCVCRFTVEIRKTDSIIARPRLGQTMEGAAGGGAAGGGADGDSD